MKSSKSWLYKLLIKEEISCKSRIFCVKKIRSKIIIITILLLLLIITSGRNTWIENLNFHWKLPDICIQHLRMINLLHWKYNSNITQKAKQIINSLLFNN